MSAIDPEDVLFWQQVREAAAQVAARNEREITIGVATKQADVFMSEGIIVIELSDRKPPQPTLIVPPGGGDKDD